MTPMALLRGFFSVLFSLILTVAVWFREDSELSGSQPGSAVPIQPWLLCEYLAVVLILAWCILGRDAAFQMGISLGAEIFFEIGIYDALLLLLMPLLRRYFRAKACALFWLLPNLLYFVQYSFMEQPLPKHLFSVSEKTLSVLLIIWGAGFLAVFSGGILRHLLFRRRILKASRTEADPAVTALWEQIQQDAGLKKRLAPPVRSGLIKTPISIGLFRASLRIVLPETAYSEAELRLVFRHELAHILRSDPHAKLFMTFCTAVCWWNPLMYPAMRCAAEDLERSCDELVLQGSGEEDRSLYAALLLKTASGATGFTTCLSASAEALRSRMRDALHPKTRSSGALALGLMLFLLLTFSGRAAILIPCGTLEDRLSPAEIAPESLRMAEKTADLRFPEADLPALRDYLMALPLTKPSGNYTLTDTERELVAVFYDGSDTYYTVLTDHALRIMPIRKPNRGTVWYLPEPTDWEAVYVLLGSPTEIPY